MNCQNCYRWPATENWTGYHDSTSIARNPSLIQRWCEQCVLTVRIKYAEECAARLPWMRARLAAIMKPTR